jgi:H+-transporting ATPase
MGRRLGYRPEGLASEEARQRLTRHGPNGLVEKRRSPVLEFLSYFWGPIPWMIEAAALFARVQRDEACSQIPARELVPSDVVRLRPGDIVPADARLIDGDCRSAGTRRIGDEGQEAA